MIDGRQKVADGAAVKFKLTDTATIKGRKFVAGQLLFGTCQVTNSACMEGRAVHKQLYNQQNQPYTAWLKLDKDNKTEGGNLIVRSWNENYGFKPEELLANKGIKEIGNDQDRDNLIRSLKKGNAQQITVEKNGSEQKYFIAANSQFKTVDLYDHKMNKLKREELLKPEVDNKRTQKQSAQHKEELPVKKQGSKKVKVS